MSLRLPARGPRWLARRPALQYILRRAVWYLATFFVAVTVNFILPRLGDASPVDVLMARATLGANIDTQVARDREEAYLKEFGLVETDTKGMIRRDAAGKPIKTTLLTQFTSYLSMSLRGELGSSMLQHQKPVSQIIWQALPWTIALQLPTIGLGWLIGNLLGALAAYRRGVFDKVFYPLALLVTAIPTFCVGMLLVYVFGIYLEWFPALGGYDEGLTPGLSWAFLESAGYYYVLPFLSVFIMWVGGQAIGMRSMCIYELGTDYVKYAKLLGLKERLILSYMFRNAVLPQLTGLALALGSMVGGALVTEMVFSYPGLGMAVLTAIQSNDYPVITGCTLLITVCVLIANFSVDVLIGVLDPRIRAAQAGET